MRGDKTLAELAEQFDVHPHQIPQGKTQFLERAAEVFGERAPAAGEQVDLKALHVKIGQLTLENDFSEGALSQAGFPQSDDRPAS